MAKWFYDSGGSPVAFERAGKVYRGDGSPLGELQGNLVVKNGRTVAEIIKDIRIARKSSFFVPPVTSYSSTPGRPGNRGAICFPSPYEDI